MEAHAPAEQHPEQHAAARTLAAERERQGLSRAEMAQRLHMSPAQVEALETGEYSRLPKGPFLRGFVRNYARALGLDVEAVLAQLAQESPRDSAPGIVVPNQNIRFDPLGDRFSSPYVKAAGIAVVAIALGFATLYWWFFVKPTPPAHKGEGAPVATTPASPTGAPPESAVTVSSGNEPATAAAPGSTAAPSTSAPGATPSTSAPVAPAAPAASATAPDASNAPSGAAPAKGEGVLRFHFTAESWVEVRGADNRVLMQRTNPADTDAEVRGPLPLRVIVGNASHATLNYNGRDFPLEPHTRVDVARFTLE